ncbi:MAG: O-methyltransferase [Bacteroidota bacterium]
MEKNIRINQRLAELNAYCEAHTTPQSDILYQLERETYLKTLAPQMMSGHLQGQFFRLLSLLMRPKTILEVGTFTGYAAICLAEGLPEDGILHTIEVNAEREFLIRKYIEKAGLKDKIHLHIGDAQAVIPTIDATFDMVFLDAGKQEYKHHYDLVIDHVNPGGLIMADNVLWSGKVIDPVHDKDTEKIRAFNQLIHEDERVENILLPIRDGIMIARKVV